MNRFLDDHLNSLLFLLFYFFLLDLLGMCFTQLRFSLRLLNCTNIFNLRNYTHLPLWLLGLPQCNTTQTTPTLHPSAGHGMVVHAIIHHAMNSITYTNKNTDKFALPAFFVVYCATHHQPACYLQ